MMVGGYSKLWASIVHSTVWRESSDTKVVWITMLALSDPGGYVAASLPGLADAARVSIEECEAALEKFRAPDPHSRTKEHEGRRIEDVDGGWFILNYRKHREGIAIEVRRAQNREAAKRHREKLAALRNPSAEPSADVSESKLPSAQAEALCSKQEAVSTATTTPPTPPTPQNVDKSNDGGNGSEKRKAQAFKIFAQLRASRVEVRTPSGLRYRIPKEGIPAEVKQAVDAIGGADAIANADEVGLRVLRGQFATAFTELA